MNTEKIKHIKVKNLFFAMVLLSMLCLSGLTSVYALTKSGNIQDGVSVKITAANTVVDSITCNGVTVNAVYKPKNGSSSYNSDPVYCCAAFVSRFYDQVYGITVGNLVPGRTPVVLSGSGSFVKTTAPQKGDIYGNSSHWAVVKAVSGNQVLLAEQNLWWDSSANLAGKGRIVPLTGNHWFFTWSGSANTGLRTTSIAVNSISLNKTSAVIQTGKTLRLSASLKPTNATNRTVTWSSSNTAVATVNSSGLVTTKYPGTAIITAKSVNGKTAVCKITVPFNKTVHISAANTNSGIVLSYTNVNYESGYKIYRKEGNGSYRYIGATKANVTRAIDRTAQAGKTYTYLIRPYRGSYLGYGSGKTVTHLKAPVLSSVTAVTGRKAVVRFKAASGNPTYYYIVYRTNGKNKILKVNTSALGRSNGYFTYTLSGLIKGNTYQVAVVAGKNNCISSYSTIKKTVITK